MSESNKNMADNLSPGYLEIVEMVNKWWEESFSSAVKHEIATDLPMSTNKFTIYVDSSDSSDDSFSPYSTSTPTLKNINDDAVSWDINMDTSFEFVQPIDPKYAPDNLDISYTPIKGFCCSIFKPSPSFKHNKYSEIDDIIILNSSNHVFEPTPKKTCMRRFGRRLKF